MKTYRIRPLRLTKMELDVGIRKINIFVIEVLPYKERQFLRSDLLTFEKNNAIFA